MSNELTQEENTIYDWLGTLGTITWGGEGWDVTDPKERLGAAKWFARNLTSLMDFVDGEEQ